MVFGQRRDGVVGAGVVEALGLATPGVDAAVRLLHEGVEVDAALVRHVGGGEEEVHQHGFAAADVADEVEAVGVVVRDVVGRPPAEEAAEQAERGGVLRVRGVAAEAVPEGLQALGGERLRRIGQQLAGFELGAVGCQRAVRGPRYGVGHRMGRALGGGGKTSLGMTGRHNSTLPA